MWAYQNDFSVFVYSLNALVLRSTKNKTLEAANPGAVQRGIERGDFIATRCKLGRLWYHLPSVKAGNRRSNRSEEQGIWSNDLASVQQSNAMYCDLQDTEGLTGDSSSTQKSTSFFLAYTIFFSSTFHVQFRY